MLWIVRVVWRVDCSLTVPAPFPALAKEAARPTPHPLVRLLEAAFPTRVAD